MAQNASEWIWIINNIYGSYCRIWVVASLELRSPFVRKGLPLPRSCSLVLYSLYIYNETYETCTSCTTVKTEPWKPETSKWHQNISALCCLSIVSYRFYTSVFLLLKRNGPEFITKNRLSQTTLNKERSDCWHHVKHTLVGSHGNRTI
jgi:hypothetical protein